MIKNLGFQLQAQLQATQHVAQTQHVEIQSLREQLRALGEENSNLKSEIVQSTDLLESAARQVDFLRQESQRLSRGSGDAQQMCLLQTKLNQASQEAISLQGQVMQLKQQLQKQAQTTQAVQQRFAAQEIENAGLQQQLELARQNFEIVSDQRDSFQVIVRQLQQQIFDMQQQQLQEQVQAHVQGWSTVGGGAGNGAVTAAGSQFGGQFAQSQTLRQSQAERELRDARQQLQEEKLASRQLQQGMQEAEQRAEQMKQDLQDCRQRAAQELQRMRMGYQQRFNEASLEFARLQQEYRTLQSENQQLRHVINVLQVEQRSLGDRNAWESAGENPGGEFQAEAVRESAEGFDEDREREPRREQRRSVHSAQPETQPFHTPDNEEEENELRLSPKHLVREKSAPPAREAPKEPAAQKMQKEPKPQTEPKQAEPIHSRKPSKRPEAVLEVVQPASVLPSQPQSVVADQAKAEEEQSESESVEDLFKSKSMLDSLCQYQQRTGGQVEDDMEVEMEAIPEHENQQEELQASVPRDAEGPETGREESPKKQDAAGQLNAGQLDQLQKEEEQHRDAARESHEDSEAEEYVYIEESEEEAPIPPKETSNEPLNQATAAAKSPQRSNERLDAIEAKVQTYSKMMKDIVTYSDKPEISLEEPPHPNSFYESQAAASDKQEKDQSTLSELRDKYDPNGMQALSQFHRQGQQVAHEDENMSISDLKMGCQEVVDDLGLDDEFEPELPPEKAEKVNQIRSMLQQQQEQQLLDRDFHDIDSLREFDEGDLAAFQSSLGKSCKSQGPEPGNSQ